MCAGGSVQYVCTIDTPVTSITWRFQGQCSANHTRCNPDDDMTVSTGGNATETFTLCGNDLTFSYDTQSMDQLSVSHFTLSLPQPLQLPLQVCLLCEPLLDYQYLSIAGTYLMQVPVREWIEVTNFS